MSEETGVRARIAELLGEAPIGILAPIERRLIAVASELLPQMIIQLRIRQDGSTVPITVPLVVEASRLALAAAVQFDQDLRDLRERMKAMA